MENTSPQNRREFTDKNALLAFLHGGNAIVTVVSRRSHTHLTFKFNRGKTLRPGQESLPLFVSVLRDRYRFLGTVWRHSGGRLVYQHSFKKSSFGVASDEANAAAWFVRALNEDVLDYVEVWHEGKCGKCGRVLTAPESLASGFGPECLATRGG